MLTAPVAIDENLISQAEAKATGQNIHAVKNIAGIYRGFLELLRRYPEDEDASTWTRQAANAKRRLEIVARTGKVVD